MRLLLILVFICLMPQVSFGLSKLDGIKNQLRLVGVAEKVRILEGSFARSLQSKTPDFNKEEYLYITGLRNNLCMRQKNLCLGDLKWLDAICKRFSGSVLNDEMLTVWWKGFFVNNKSPASKSAVWNRIASCKAASAQILSLASYLEHFPPSGIEEIKKFRQLVLQIKPRASETSSLTGSLNQIVMMKPAIVPISTLAAEKMLGLQNLNVEPVKEFNKFVLDSRIINAVVFLSSEGIQESPPLLKFVDKFSLKLKDKYFEYDFALIRIHCAVKKIYLKIESCLSFISSFKPHAKTKLDNLALEEALAYLRVDNTKIVKNLFEQIRPKLRAGVAEKNAFYAWWNLAMSRAEQSNGNWSKAMYYLERFLSRIPPSSSSYIKGKIDHAKILRESGRTEEALKILLDQRDKLKSYLVGPSATQVYLNAELVKVYSGLKMVAKKETTQKWVQEHVKGAFPSIKKEVQVAL